MGLVKISELPTLAVENVSNNDFVPVVDIPPTGTTRTKKILLQDLFVVAPVKSVNGKSSGDILLASTDLTDSSDIGRITEINGFSSGVVSLGSSHLSDATDIAKKSEIGSVAQFTAEYNNPTSGALQTEFQELARLVGNDVANARVSLFAVQSTANSALQKTEAEQLYVTQTSLGNFSGSDELASIYATKTELSQGYATKTELNSYATKTSLSNDYATLEYVNDQIASNSGSGSSIFNSNHLVATSASIATSVNAGSIRTSGSASVGSLSAIGQLSALRASVGDGGTGVGTNSALYVNGNANINGTLVANSLEILGSTIVKNTQVVEMSDDFIELNKASTDTATGQVGGIKVETGRTEKAELSWDNSVSIWQFKIGGELANLRANNVVTTEVFGTMEEFETALTTALAV